MQAAGVEDQQGNQHQESDYHDCVADGRQEGAGKGGIEAQRNEQPDYRRPAVFGAVLQRLLCQTSTESRQTCGWIRVWARTVVPQDLASLHETGCDAYYCPRPTS